jgi:hypothetical protein
METNRMTRKERKERKAYHEYCVALEAQVNRLIERDIADGVTYLVMPWGSKVLVDGNGLMIGPRRDTVLDAVRSVESVLARR